MNVVYLTILFSIVILLPCSISDKQCPSAGIAGCFCSYTIKHIIICNFVYTGDDIPLFSNSTRVYDEVSYKYYAWLYHIQCIYIVIYRLCYTII